MGVDGSTCSECFPMVASDSEPPEHVLRTSARSHTCAVVLGRAPCVPRGREHDKHDKIPVARREEKADAPKKHISTYPW